MHITSHPAAGRTEAEMALEQIDDPQEQGFKVKAMGADKGYQNERFVSGCREHGVKPHVAQVEGRKVKGLYERTSRAKDYAASMVIRCRVEELFRWMKTVGGMRKSSYRGVERRHMAVQFCATRSNLLRILKLSLSGPSLMEVAREAPGGNVTRNCRIAADRPVRARKHAYSDASGLGTRPVRG